MAAQNKELVNGVESIEFATFLTDGSIDPTSWVKGQNFASGSVVYTTNADTITSIIPEDKFTSIFTIATPGDPDTFNFNCFELSIDNYQRFFNVAVDATTSTITVLAQKKRANLAIRLTTQPVNGVKKIYLYSNTECTVSYAENFTKEALVQLAVSASIMAYTALVDAVEKDAIYTVQTVNADGSPINANPPVVAAGANSTSTTSTKALTGTATPVSPKTIVSQLWTLVSKPVGTPDPTMTTPTALTCTMGALETGVYVFKLTATDSGGIKGSGTTQVTVTIP